MRRFILAIAAAGFAVTAGAFGTGPAAALPVNAPAIGGLTEDMVSDVHCVPGWWHHRLRPHDGCYVRVVPRRNYYVERPFRPYYRERRIVRPPFRGGPVVRDRHYRR